MKQLHMVGFLLVIIGALNWGLVGLFGFNVVNALVGSFPMLERLVYVLVGVSAVYIMVTHKTDCKVCGMPEKKMAMPSRSKKRSR